MPHRKMSNEEQRVQHETISNIDNKVTGIDDKFTEFKAFVIKLGKIWFPIFGIFFAGIGSIITLTITGYKWEGSLVKQEQFSRHEQREIFRDSSLNAKIDTVDRHKINYTDIKPEKTELARNRSTLKGVTQVKNEDGTYSYKGVY